MSEYQNYYDNFARANVWASPVADECGCHGHGWWLSEVDTWHECPYHYAGQQHPEDDTDPVLYALSGLFGLFARAVKVEPRLGNAGYPSDPNDDIPF